MSTKITKVKLEMEELDITATECRATYEEMKTYVKDKLDFKVSTLYISRIKRKCEYDGDLEP